MNKYSSFVFEGFNFDQPTKTLTLKYGFDDTLHFEEKLTFNFDFVKYNQDVLDRAILILYYLAGVSYYKAYSTDAIIINHGRLDKPTANFMSEVYQKGLGEYFYINKLDPKTEIPFVSNSHNLNPLIHDSNKGSLIGLGGGKDSLVTVELLKHLPNTATWSLGHGEQMSPLVEKIGLPHFSVERQIDPLLLELNNTDALNGHIPISAIFSAVGTAVAVLAGYQDVVVSNENSSNEATLTYDQVDINHQYSKSLAYEKMYQSLLMQNFGDSLRYYSFLRPLSEVRISEIFSKIAFDKYKDVFSSCNRAFVQDSHGMSWCGKCSKCAFTFLALTPFIDRFELEQLWGKNLLLDDTLNITYENLLGLSGDKPLDCVGEIKESRQAMKMAQKIYPKLYYQFQIPADYNYTDLAVHSMPVDKYKMLVLS